MLKSKFRQYISRMIIKSCNIWSLKLCGIEISVCTFEIIQNNSIRVWHALETNWITCNESKSTINKDKLVSLMGRMPKQKTFNMSIIVVLFISQINFENKLKNYIIHNDFLFEISFFSFILNYPNSLTVKSLNYL